ncbi:hypothetical protein G7Y89_g6836 [Cudoniella acicularis]|uniref:SET domain-containing protein n=1 Tax=Cudoniella acicularis TaxID=354080 RepID=A0A8H4W549_9HELO|nr:hypothetical protein G7Y89_g6836 [Cudoniella acicularis]
MALSKTPLKPSSSSFTLNFILLLSGIAQACTPNAITPQLASLGALDGICTPRTSFQSIVANDSQEVTGSFRPIFDDDEEGVFEVGSEDEDDTLPSQIYEIKSTPNKGLGVFALQDLPPGTTILVEAPLVSVPMPEMVPGHGFRIASMLTSLQTAFSLLSPPDQSTYLSLHEYRFPSEETQDKLLTIFRSNAYNTGPNRIGLFPECARINHDCTPNSGNYWSQKQGKRIIFASRLIKAGEEITVSYIPLLKKTAIRRERLAQYGFVCSCEACTRQDGGEGDKHRARIASLLEGLEEKVQGGESE